MNVLNMDKIVIPSIDEIVEINERLGYSVVKLGALDFILASIKSRRLTKDSKKDISTAAATIWYEIISQHPFIDGNKRTAAEAMKLLLELNGLEPAIPMNGIVYISLKIANNDMALNQLQQFIYERLQQ